jgi:hypothetical protein
LAIVRFKPIQIRVSLIALRAMRAAPASSPRFRSNSASVQCLWQHFVFLSRFSVHVRLTPQTKCKLFCDQSNPRERVFYSGVSKEILKIKQVLGNYHFSQKQPSHNRTKVREFHNFYDT